MKGQPLIAALVVVLSQILAVYSATFLEDITLTRHQSSNFQKFKAQVAPKVEESWMTEDLYLLRFFKAKNFDVNRAVEFFNSHMTWWRDNRMSTIDEEDWSDLKDYHYDINGRDKEGRVILRADFGDWDIRKQVVAGKLNRLVRYSFKMWNDANRKTDFYASQGQNVTRFVMIIDMANINAIQHVNPTCIPFYLAIAAAYDPHFPLMGDNIYYLNTAGLFETLLALVKPILGETTRNALKVYGKDPKVWKPIIDQYIDESQLPPSYGGTLVE